LKHEKINLLDEFPMLLQPAELSIYIIDNSVAIDMDRRRPMIIICPGGGYEKVSDREAEPVAFKFIAAGYNVAVIKYSVAPVRYPNQLLQVSAAIALVRRRSEEWNTDTEKIVVCGFSAGGHLAASVGVLWQEEFIRDNLKLKHGENKPNAMLLAYPVISGGEYAHRASFDNLLGDTGSKEKIDYLSLENRVSPNTPPTFLWHTTDDDSVPCENSLMFAVALKRNNISLELHIYRSGCHGLSLCSRDTAKDVAIGKKNPLVNSHIATWFSLGVEWIEELFEAKYNI
jgi:acetyl esterase/lipase